MMTYSDQPAKFVESVAPPAVTMHVKENIIE
jgi:hypothetical protein